MNTSLSFRDRYPEFRHLLRELHLVRNHNRGFKEGDPQDQLLLFAESGLVCLALERFVRVVLGADASDSDTLPNLLEKGVAKGLFQVPWDDPKEGIRCIKSIRNTLLHSNYEQAAREGGCTSVAEYFKTQFAAELDLIYRITDFIVGHIDPETGKPRNAG